MTQQHDDGDKSLTARAVGAVAPHLLFAFLTFLLGASLIRFPHGSPVCQPTGDLGVAQWDFWWADQVIRGLAPAGDGFFRSSLIFHPLGADLTYQTFEFTYVILLWPLRAIGGGFLQHNVALLIATYLMAWFSWLAARSFGAGRMAAVLCATVLTLHGYRLAEAIHLNIFSTWIFPLVVCALQRIRVNPERWRNGGLLGVAANLAIFTSIFHTLAAALFAFAFIAVFYFRDDMATRRRRFMNVALAVALVAPGAMLIGWHIAHAPKPPAFGDGAQSAHAADVWQFLIHPRIRMALLGIANDSLIIPMDMQQRVWIWYLPGYLCVIGAMIARRRAAGDSALKFLVYAGFGFWILALGPWLKIGSPLQLDAVAGSIPLPGKLLRMVPLLGSMRSVWHFGFIGTICMTIYASIVIMRALGEIREPSRRVVYQGLFIAAAACESFIGSIATFTLPMDGAANYIAAYGRPGDSVAVFPQYLYVARGHFMYHQTVHGLPMLGGYLARDPIAFDDWKTERRWPIELEEASYGRINAMSPEAVANFHADVEGLHIRYIEILDDTNGRRFAARMHDQLEKIGPWKVGYTDQWTVVIEKQE
ncbi:hypothetical protein BH09SUM1_BH09SUM1_33110 [soil metagenome]